MVMNNTCLDQCEPQEAKCLWTPSKSSRMSRFIDKVSEKYGIEGNYTAVHQWSVEHIDLFWREVLFLTGIKYQGSIEKVVDPNAKIADGPTEWFTGVEMNYAENLLSRGEDSDVCLIEFDERYLKEVRVSRGELKRKVAQVQKYLRERDLQRGDVVAIYTANCHEALVFALAASALGAIFSTISADFGAEAVVDRFKQINPKFLLASITVHYNGKLHSQVGKIRHVLYECQIPSTNCLLVGEASPEESILSSSHHIHIDSLFGSAIGELVFEPLPFNHPLCILYSSGTTGKPKCIVHSVGGTLLQHLKEHLLHGDVDQHDVFLQFSSIGWMMWHWSISVLAIPKVVLVLFDGSPLKPHPQDLWNRMAQLKVTHFGSSAKYFITLQEQGVSIPALETLRVMFSTGSPLPSSTFEYLYNHVKGDMKTRVMLASITGGTDIISLFCGGNPVLKVHSGEIQCKCLGMDVSPHPIKLTNDGGDSNGDSSELSGDLVCRTVFPSMPIYFWNDPQGKVYQRTYFETIKGVWFHGDYLRINPHTGGIIMLGRSDGTLNPRGIRFGSADLYNVLADKAIFPQILDSLAVGIRRPDLDEDVVLFIKCSEHPPHLEELIVQNIRSKLSPRHVPSKIVQVDDIPYTVNGKKMEVAVKRILNGHSDMVVENLSNPESLEFFRRFKME